MVSYTLKAGGNGQLHTGYVYMHSCWFNRILFIPIGESECNVYMNAI